MIVSIRCPAAPDLIRASVRAVLAMLVALASPATRAQSVQWSGYGTLAAYQAHGDGVRLRPDNSVANTAGDGQWRADGDTRLGLQARWSPLADVEAVLQAESRDDLDRGWKPELRWAYLAFKPAPDWMLRLGRQELPFLQHSETRSVRYAQPTVRPDPSVYSLNPGAPINGINLAWERPLASGILRAEGGWGRSSSVRAQNHIEVPHLTSVMTQWQNSQLLLRVAASDFRIDLERNPLTQLAASGLCSNCAALSTGVARSHGIEGSVVALLLAWEPGSWGFSAEVLERTRSNSVLLPRSGGWSLQGRYRSGPWQPYLSFGKTHFREPSPGLQPAPGLPAAALNTVQAFDRFLQQPFDQRTVQLGVRWDFAERMALKLQWERWSALRDTQVGRQGEINLFTPPLGTQAASWNGVARMTSLSLDFVF